MQARNKQEVQLLTDFRKIPEKERAFLMAYAASARADHAKSVPAPKILISGVNVDCSKLVC